MTAHAPDGITLISPHTKDLGGGFLVRRALPSLPRPRHYLI